MITKEAIQLLIIVCAMVVCAYSKEYILEDLVAMEDNNRRYSHNSAVTANINNEGESQRITKRPITIARHKKADDGEKGGGESVTETVKKNSNKDDDDEDKASLAQQVADGKYGLIQKEIFPEEPQRPGIISYEVNPEVPRDNVNNLGGLKPEEIWLAENHLLVLAGGGKYSEDRDNVNNPSWPPIDNYKAPPRQVKIPPNPKVPPPFPVQLRPGGPTEFIRGINGTGGPPPFPFFPPPGGNFSGTIPQSPFFPPPAGLYQGNFTPGNGPYGPIQPFPFPPPTAIRNGSIRPPPTGFFPPGIPPGANFLPPPGNFTEPLDEDDPSIYYPPPYDFVYKRENGTAVPPGPLVPGIILPPPPDFFAPLEEERRPKTKRPPARKSKRPQQPPSAYRGKSQHGYPSTTTRRPAVQIVTDEPFRQPDLNEVTPATLKHAIPPNAVISGWVPIPAPRPFYITGPRKPLVQNPRLNNAQQNGYDYDKPEAPLRTLKDQAEWTESNITRPVLFSPDGGQNYLRQNGYPEAFKVPYRPTTTISPAPYRPAPGEIDNQQKGKALKTFYFYEEPIQQQVAISSPIPPEWSECTVGCYTTARPSALEYFNTPQPPLKQHTTNRPASPLQYFYITKPPTPLETSTDKPPVYEYSYTAPGYGTLEAPKLSGASTPRPPQSLQYDNYYDYDVPRSSTPYPAAPYSTTQSPPILRTTTPRPEISYDRRPETAVYNQRSKSTQKTTTSSPYIVQTENPYHAYFTQHDISLIDDITKKYFTIFGQKLNFGDGPTTPLSPVSHLEDVTAKTPPPVQQNTHKKVKFPTASQPTSQQPPYSQKSYPYYWSTQRPSVQQNIYQRYPEYDYYEDSIDDDQKLDYRYKTIQDLYNTGFGRQPQHAGLIQRPHQVSYEGDTRVNFVQPLPPKNPDAEEFETVSLKNRYRPRPAGLYTPGRAQAQSTTPPPSLVHDTRVNYLQPLPNKEPLAEEFDPELLKSRYDHQGQNRPSNAAYPPYSIKSVGLVQSTRPPPISLHGDTDVNYAQPLPPINPDAEEFDPRTRQKIITDLYQQFVGRAQSLIQRPRLQPSLAADTRVNDLYAKQNPTPEPQSELYNPSSQRQTDGLPSDSNPGQNGVIAYTLPGNGGGHFYFLTPQSVGYPSSDIQQNIYRRNVRRQSNQDDRRYERRTGSENNNGDERRTNNNENRARKQ
ncbi:uncharacterized protein LOC142332285 [Lycorma delicatula]|uniref:uncharacterized protein LOC142332285 n=1 Tax=Lycorma delicatula TaxID=130591 RepID=UPI003F518FF1